MNLKYENVRTMLVIPQLILKTISGWMFGIRVYPRMTCTSLNDYFQVFGSHNYPRPTSKEEGKLVAKLGQESVKRFQHWASILLFCAANCSRFFVVVVL